MSEKSVAEKTHIKPGTRVAVLNEAPGVVGSLGLPADTAFVDVAQAQIVMLFVRDRAELDHALAGAVAALAPGAVLWVFYRKGARGAGLDMSRDTVWALAEGLGLRPLGLVSVDGTWSAFRLRPGR